MLWLVVGVLALLVGVQYLRSLPLVWHMLVGVEIIPALIRRRRRLAGQGWEWWHEIGDNSGSPRRVVRHHRVWLDDMDLNMHMNNSSYYKYADVNVYALLAGSGMIEELIVGRGWSVSNGGVYIQFKNSLRYLERYRIESYIDGYDDRWIFVRHDFLRPGVADRPCATGFVKLLVKDAKGRDQDPHWVLTSVMTAAPSPQQPAGFSSLRSLSLKNIEDGLRKPQAAVFATRDGGSRSLADMQQELSKPYPDAAADEKK